MTREPTRKPTPLSIATMVSMFTVSLLIALCGCTPTIDKALHRTDQGLGILDITITEGAELYGEAARIAIRRCASEIVNGTESQRHACLERQGFSPEQIARVEAAVTKLRDAYDMMADAMQTVREALPVLREAQERAKAVLR